MARPRLSFVIPNGVNIDARAYWTSALRRYSFQKNILRPAWRSNQKLPNAGFFDIHVQVGHKLATNFLNVFRLCFQQVSPPRDQTSSRPCIRVRFSCTAA